MINKLAHSKLVLGITIAVVIVILIPLVIMVVNSHKRSIANHSLWETVLNHDSTTVAKSTQSPYYQVTLPCSTTSKYESFNNFTGFSAMCYYINPSYSTKFFSTAKINSVQYNIANGNLTLPTTEYYFEEDTASPGTSYRSLQSLPSGCVNSTVNSNNTSNIPGEVMYVKINKTMVIQTGLGNNTEFSECEWDGTKGTVQLDAQTVQNNSVLFYGLTATNSNFSGLNTGFNKFLVSTSLK